ncbi:NlpC/P60 family protein [Kitasatospora sp. NPDC051984]|uniref:C40 family peptidase n=1 Tax=Kitasatospora sp. NPDC051984 TaxID=3364059 RepID=UPI0037C61602
MPVHRRPPLPGVQRLARALALTAAATGVIHLGVAPAAATPADPPDRADVKAQVDQLYDEAEQASEKYNAAQEQQKRLQREAGILLTQVAAGQDDLNRLRADLGAVVAAQYRAQGLDPTLRLMLDNDPASYLAGARSLGQATARQNETLRDLRERQRRLDQRRQETAAKLDELEQARHRLAAAKDEVRTRLARARQLLGDLTAAERDRLAYDDDARAARGADRFDLGNEPPASDRAAAALNAAVSKIGSSYVYGSTGPSTFDCSGLMYWAWRQAGVTLPRTSQGQASAGRRVSLAEARPGDLVIFFKDRHHVGMYAGGGVVVHAPHPGARVRYESVSAMPVNSVVRV